MRFADSGHWTPPPAARPMGDGLMRGGDVQSADEMTPAVIAGLRITRIDRLEDCFANRVSIGRLVLKMPKAKQETGDAADNRCGEAGAGQHSNTVASSQDPFAKSKHTLLQISVAPVAGIQGAALDVHGANGNYVGERCRHMQAIAAVVAPGGHDEDALAGTLLDGIGEELAGFTRLGKTASADIDDIGPALDRERDGARQVDLGAWRDLSIRAVREDGNDQPAAARCDPLYGCAGLTEHHARNMRAVGKRRPGNYDVGRLAAESCKICAGKTGMGKIDRAIDDRNTNRPIAPRLLLEVSDTRNP
jgi:hypothetical protein